MKNELPCAGTMFDGLGYSFSMWNAGWQDFKAGVETMLVHDLCKSLLQMRVSRRLVIKEQRVPRPIEKLSRPFCIGTNEEEVNGSIREANSFGTSRSSSSRSGGRSWDQIPK